MTERRVQIKQINGSLNNLTVDADVSKTNLRINLTVSQIPIAAFKSRVSELTGVAASEMRLIYKAKQLVDNTKLSEYGKFL